jgi:predicted nucleic acid-binding protein
MAQSSSTVPQMICIDASFVVRFITGKNPDSPADQLWKQWQQSRSIMVVPTLFFYEVSNALHRYAVSGQLTQQEVQALLDRVLGFDLSSYGDSELHRQALKIAQRENLPAAYDAHYLALAERLETEFWTGDRLCRLEENRRLFNTVRSRLTWVHLVS